MKSLARVKRRTVNVIRVFRSPLCHTQGLIRAGVLEMRCALGRGGTVRDKREGDGGTPIARMAPLGLFVRADRLGRPRTALPVRITRPMDGWCDDPTSRLYNVPIQCPTPVRHERMWRDDALYDLVVDLSWNRGPIRRGRGSAIFLHVCRDGFQPTEGCIAVDRSRIGRLVGLMGPRTRIAVIA